MIKSIFGFLRDDVGARKGRGFMIRSDSALLNLLSMVGMIETLRYDRTRTESVSLVDRALNGALYYRGGGTGRYTGP